LKSRPRATIDHLVVAAATLADGIDYAASLTGAVPHPGGKHVAMGTHNALLRLGEKLYLEIIAIDPASTKPARRRWFGLDDVALQSELTESPRLIHWVARTDDIDQAARCCPVDLGSVHAMSRGEYRWRITIPEDGALPGRGLIPTLIQWDVPMHPAHRLPQSHVSLVELAGTHRGDLRNGVNVIWESENRRLDRLDDRLVRGSLGKRAPEPLQPCVEVREQQIVLRGEVSVERSQRYSRVRGDLLSGGVLDSLSQEPNHRRLPQRFARAFASGRLGRSNHARKLPHRSCVNIDKT